MSNVNPEPNHGGPGNAGDQQQAGYQPPHQVNSGGSSRACLYGCLFLVIGSILFVVCGVFGAYYLTRSQIQKYTSTEPMELPTVDLPEEELQALETRIETFSQTLDEGETPDEDLVLTAEEINALIAAEEQARGKVFVTIEDGLVSGDVSIPTDFLRYVGGKGRYFNGSATFSVSMEDGVLIVVPTAMSVNGEPLPEEFVQAMAQQNWAQDLYKDPEAAKTLGKFDDIEIRDDKIILKLKRDASEINGEASANDQPEADNPEPVAEESPADDEDADEQPSTAGDDDADAASQPQDDPTESEAAAESEPESETDAAEDSGEEAADTNAAAAAG